MPEPIFDLGSGDGHFASVAFDDKLDVGMDPWAGPTKEAKSWGAYHLLLMGEGAKIPFKAATFASVVSNSVLEHIPEINPVLNEVFRILRPGGLFVFCVPNNQFPEQLWGRQVLEKFGLSRLAGRYSRFFNHLSRHAHTDSPLVWQKRLERSGLDVVKTFNYFPPAALHILEWGHPFGLPALFCKKIFGRWILVPQHWNLGIPWQLTRRFLEQPITDEGVYSFFIAQKQH